ncbi:hypothetical protein ACFSVJ_14035 [Prauserella oleivorans]
MTDTTGNLERVPVGHRFASGAADALAPVARDLDVVREQVQDGRLHLDPDAAHELLAAITRLQSRVHTLIADGSERIDQPLRFGANFVARAMSERLRGAASGEPTRRSPCSRISPASWRSSTTSCAGPPG